MSIVQNHFLLDRNHWRFMTACDVPPTSQVCLRSWILRNVHNNVAFGTFCKEGIPKFRAGEKHSLGRLRVYPWYPMPRFQIRCSFFTNHQSCLTLHIDNRISSHWAMIIHHRIKVHHKWQPKRVMISIMATIIIPELVSSVNFVMWCVYEAFDWEAHYVLHHLGDFVESRPS